MSVQAEFSTIWVQDLKYDLVSTSLAITSLIPRRDPFVLDNVPCQRRQPHRRIPTAPPRTTRVYPNATGETQL